MRDEPNPYKDLPGDKLAQFCRGYAEQIPGGERRTKAGDNTAYLIDAAAETLEPVGIDLPATNPFGPITPEELHAACMRAAGELRERKGRTKLGDAIGYLLIAAAWELAPHESPDVGDQFYPR